MADDGDDVLTGGIEKNPPKGFETWADFEAAVDANTTVLRADSLEGLMDEIEAYAAEREIDLTRRVGEVFTYCPSCNWEGVDTETCPDCGHDTVEGGVVV